MAELTVNGVRLHVQQFGSGERVAVFVHGLAVDNLSSWFFTLASSVSRKSEVVLYDLRGHGKSERPATGYAVSDMRADLVGLLDALDLGDRKIDLIGNSYGGLVAITMAVEHPERINSLVLLDAHVPDEHWSGRIQKMLTVEGEERDEWVAHTLRRVKDSYRDWLQTRSALQNSGVTKQARALIDGTSLVADIEQSPVFSEEQLAAIDCPVLAFYGEESDFRDRGELLATLLPDFDLRIVPEATHTVLWEAPERLKSEIVEWLEAHPG